MGEYQHALVTGASSGLGAVFAERLARDRCDLILVARSLDRLNALAERLRARDGVAVQVLAADLTEPKGVATVEDKIAGAAGLDLLVNNAGFGTLGRFAGLELGGELAEVQLNVVAVLRLTRAALPAMLARGRGAIINVSSLAGFQPGPYNATYTATKAFVTSFSESISEEVRGTGVRIQALCPGFTHTEFQARAGLDTARIPSMAWMQPEQVIDESFAALSRGTVVCVPGPLNRALKTFSGAVPRRALRRFMGVAAKRSIT